MCRLIFCLTGCLILTTVPSRFVNGAEEDSGFAAAQWTISQIAQFELDEDGRLRLKRDHWELAAKRPLQTKSNPDDDENPAIAARQREMALRARAARRQEAAARRRAEQSPIEKLFDRVSIETGGSGTISRWQNGDVSEYAWRSPLAAGNLRMQDTLLEVQFTERRTGERFLKIDDGDDLTWLSLGTPTEFAEFHRSDSGVHFVSFINDEAVSLTGRTFVEVVQKNPVHFETVNQSLLNGVVHLPIASAIAADLPDGEGTPAFPEIDFGAGQLTNHAVQVALAPLVRFRSDGGRFRINHFFGNRDVLEAEIEVVRQQYGDILDRAVNRLEELDVPQVQIDRLRARFDVRHEDAGGFARDLRNESGDEAITLFRQLRSSAGAGGMNSSEGGGEYYFRMHGGAISATMRRDDTGFELETRDEEVLIRVTETGFHTELRIESETGRLIVSQADGQPCRAMLIGRGELEFLQGPSLVALVNDNEAAWRARFLPVFEQYAVRGLDPFDLRIVAAVVRHAGMELPQTFDAEKIVGETDSIALPLMYDAEYLRVLAARLDRNDRQRIERRIRALKGE